MADETNDNDDLAAMLTELEKQSAELTKTTSTMETELRELHELQDKVEAGVIKFSKAMKDLPAGTSNEKVMSLRHDQLEFQKVMPITGGPFVELFLGKMNVRFPRKKERLQFKKEYELFKQRLSIVFVVLSLVSLVLQLRWVHMGLQLCLSYYYVTIAIRENILRENGSNIKSWWIQHHYLMVGCGVILMTWPPGEPYRLFSRELHAFGFYTSFLQIFLTRYQMARLYTLLALGKAGEMDVVNSDSTQIHWADSMNFLLPMILCGHLFQLFLAIHAFRIFWVFPHDVHPLLVSLCNAAMFLGNFVTTMWIVVEKAKRKRSQESTTHRTIANSIADNHHSSVSIKEKAI